MQKKTNWFYWQLFGRSHN